MKRTKLIALLALLATIAWCGNQGPDSFGYAATDAVPYSFEDISTTGVAVLAGSDDAKALVNIGFPFLFYGQSYDSVCVSSNGLLSFGGCNADFANQDLTATKVVGDLPTIAPLWFDLTFSVRGAGAVYYQTLGSQGSRRLVVQWQNAFPLNGAKGITFQAILYENGRILFQYLDVNAGAGSAASMGGAATVGIRAPGGESNGNRLQWSYKVPVLRNNLAIEVALAGLSPVELGAAGPGHWAALALDTGTGVTMSGGSVVAGAVAHVGSNGNVTVSGTSNIGGALWLNTAGKLTRSGGAAVAGGVVQSPAGDATLQQATADANAAAAAASALTATITTPASYVIPNAKQSVTITGGPGRNVILLTSLTMTGGSLTLSAPPGATFVVNVTASLTMAGQSKIQVAGGIAPLSVVFNVGGAVTMSGGAEFTGILLAPGSLVNLAPPTVNGEVIAERITISGDGQIVNPQQ